MSSNTEVISHWSTLIENFQFSPQKFYEMVAEAVARRQMPNATIGKVRFKEGNFLSAYRQYLKVYCGKEKFYFAICGGPFGTGFFVSYWQLQQPDGCLVSLFSSFPATGDDNPLSAKANDLSYRKEQLRRLQDEVIDMEDLKTGVSITDLGLNDFRMDLVKYVKENGDLAGLPNGLHAIIPPNDKGLKPGAIFALRNRNQGIKIAHHNRLHPYYLVYVGNDSDVIVDHTEVKRLLDLVRSSCAGRPEPIVEACRIFNEKTDDGRNMDFCSGLLNKAINSIIEIKDGSDLDSLFSPGRTTALVDALSGLDDFELVAFIVVQEAE